MTGNRILIITAACITAVALALGIVSAIIFSPRTGKIATVVQEISVDINASMPLRIGSPEARVIDEEGCTALKQALNAEVWRYSKGKTGGSESVSFYAYGISNGEHMVAEYYITAYSNGVLTINGKDYESGDADFYNAVKAIHEKHTVA